MISDMPAWLSDLPIMVKLLVSLGAILAINGVARSLTVATVCGTLILAVWTGHAWFPGDGGQVGWFLAADGWSFWRGEPGEPGILLITAQRLFGLNNLMLIAIILLVLWLSTLMGRTGVMTDLVTSVRHGLGRRASMGMLPAVIGWLPMPGGAVFSAPLLDECDREGGVTPMDKTRINYWFRHVWEYWWPLYPGVLLAMHYAQLEPAVFVPLMLPLSIASFLVGWWFLLRRVPRENPAPKMDRSSTEPCAPENPPVPRPGFLRLISPILVVVGVYTVIRLVLPWLQEGVGLVLGPGPCAEIVRFLLGNRYTPMLVGLVAALLHLGWWRPLPWADWRVVIGNRRALLLVLLVCSVRVFGAFVEAEVPGRGPVVGIMQEELAAWGIPLLLVIMILPFVSGMATGLAIGFVGASLPVVLNLAGGPTAPADQMVILPLAYTCGYMGMILSPVHICLVVTNRHFETNLRGSLVRLVPPALGVLVFAGGYFLVLLALKNWLTG